MTRAASAWTRMILPVFFITSTNYNTNNITKLTHTGDILYG
jgi:hypothetical protein